MMVTERITMKNPAGIHLRPAERISETAIRYRSRITFRSTDGEREADAKSILSILAACVRFDDEIELCCEGPDEEEALAAMHRAISRESGEIADE